ncbi:hypothetical protein [Shinella zoogloeoides]|uniref:hypothetical protein n=1 Tax=Shinella zoogloeoides TaxID=352475 RepID=UPI00273D5ADE|nr:hypothetical protein [Shinella zoogloeoides]WLR90960.1 hypothetical protein Q9316_00860 [Shinella zoogloeoides]
MRHQISSERHTEILSHDLREVFELLADRRYLDVIATNNHGAGAVTGRLVTFSDRSSCYHMSAVYAHDGLEYGFEKEIREGCATEQFFLYDTLEDARAHAVEILATVTDDV